MNKYRRIFMLIATMIVAMQIAGQTVTQKCLVRMIQRSATNSTVPVAGVRVQVGNVESAASDENGCISLSVPLNDERSFTITDVKVPNKSNLQWVVPSRNKKLYLSQNTLEIILVHKGDTGSITKASYQKLLRKYNALADTIRNLRKENENLRDSLTRIQKVSRK